MAANENGITRRRLVGGAAAAAGATLARPAWSRAKSPRRAHPGGRRVDVAVVGAGLAGLTAAREFVRARQSVAVLEADERVGGRTENRSLGNGKVTELKGEYVGPTQDRILALASELGVPTFKTYNQGDNVLFLDGRRSTYPTTSPIPPVPGVATELVLAVLALDSMASKVPVGAPWEAPDARDWDSQTFETWKEANLPSKESRLLFDAAVNAIWGADARDFSLLFALWYIAAAGNSQQPGNLERLVSTGGGAQESRFVGGSQLISIKLAEQLGRSVVLESPVRLISQSRGGVTVETDRHSIRAKRVVVTIPPAMTNQIAYDPPLPPQRAQLIQRMPAGTLIKAEAIYPTPFWRQSGLTGQAVSDTGPARTTFDNSPPDGRPGVLFGFIGGEDARTWWQRPSEQRRAAVLDQFATYFGAQARSPIDYVENNAASEEWIRGCPTTHWPTGVLLNYGPAIREPIDRIHWAGSETSTYWVGYMDGAVRSGERVAREVLAEL
jgi:monoamine oxidase